MEYGLGFTVASVRVRRSKTIRRLQGLPNVSALPHTKTQCRSCARGTAWTSVRGVTRGKTDSGKGVSTCSRARLMCVREREREKDGENGQERGRGRERRYTGIRCADSEIVIQAVTPDPVFEAYFNTQKSQKAINPSTTLISLEDPFQSKFCSHQCVRSTRPRAQEWAWGCVPSLLTFGSFPKIGGPNYSTLNSRILIIRTLNYGTPYFRKLAHFCIPHRGICSSSA